MPLKVHTSGVKFTLTKRKVRKNMPLKVHTSGVKFAPEV